MPDELHLWFWTITDPLTKRRRQTRYKMTENDARQRFGGDAAKVDGSLEVRRVTLCHTSDFMRNRQ